MTPPSTNTSPLPSGGRAGPAALWAVVGLLALYWVMAVSVSPRMGVTADEPGHLTAGYSYWHENDYRLSPEAGNLPMRVAALPLLALGLHFPPANTADWRATNIVPLGSSFFFDLGNPLGRMLLAGRAMIALFGVLTIWLIWRWARGLFGAAAGWFALVMAVFCPALLAHGGVITSDMALTACLLAAVTTFWRLIHVVTWGRLAIATIACGAVLLAKMSGALAAPMLVILLFVRWLHPAPLVLRLGGTPRWLRSQARRVVATLGLAVAVAAGSLVLLWGGFGFRYQAFNGNATAADHFTPNWPQILGEAPLAPANRPGTPAPSLGQSGMTRLIGGLRERHLLPEAYLYGLANMYQYSRARNGFLNGEVRAEGWPEFFPLAFLLKSTVPTVIFAAAGFILLGAARGRDGRTRRWRLHRASPLLVLFAVYWAVALQTTLNIGHRHILPIYPVVYVVCGVTAAWLVAGPARRWGRIAAGLAVFAHAADSLVARPFYVSYFSPAAGGPDRGWQHLVDSSFDWGQGLPDLADWLAQRHLPDARTPVFLTYFGADSPRARALPVIRFGDAMNDSGVREFPAWPRGGWYVIAATHFHRVYLHLSGPWTEEREQRYRALEASLRLPAGPVAGSTDNAAEIRVLNDTKEFEGLMFARLCHYLSQSEPADVIGGSLLAFRLTDAEITYVLNAPFAAFHPAGPNRPAPP